MRKIVSGLFVSLDGVVESPERWNTPYFNDEIGAELGSQMAAADTMLLGRVTYEEFAAFWADKGSDVPFAEAINGIPKLVASRTLEKVDWQNTKLINGNLVDRLTELKQQPGKDIVTSGSATLVACVAGEGSFLVVEGPAGIGKSSLLAAGRARAGAAGLSVLQARGSELEQAFAYGLVRQLFEPVAPRERTERATVFREAAARATRVFDPDPDDTHASEPDAFALVHGLYWLTVNVSESRPLLLVIDDLQWADNASLRWLGYLTRRIEGHPIGVLAAARPSAEEDPLLSELLTDRATTVVRPNTLSTTAVAALARSVVGAHAEEAFSLACHDATGGNPLLVHELLRTLAAEAVPATAASVPIVETTAPDAVTRSVNVRLSRLGDDAQAIAAAVAVLGDGAEPNSVAQMAELDHTALAAAAAALSRAHLFAPGTPPRFVHPLVRNAVYERIRPDDRLQHHAHAAQLQPIVRPDAL